MIKTKVWEEQSSITSESMMGIVQKASGLRHHLRFLLRRWVWEEHVFTTAVPLLL